ncbi:MAG: hypothetical protein AVDCRST_MAG59-3124, partial [uncultured Thermomicrobiales bacterium]
AVSGWASKRPRCRRASAFVPIPPARRNRSGPGPAWRRRCVQRRSAWSAHVTPTGPGGARRRPGRSAVRRPSARRCRSPRGGRRTRRRRRARRTGGAPGLSSGPGSANEAGRHADRAAGQAHHRAHAGSL